MKVTIKAKMCLFNQGTFSISKSKRFASNAAISTAIAFSPILQKVISMIQVLICILTKNAAEIHAFEFQQEIFFNLKIQ